MPTITITRKDRQSIKNKFGGRVLESLMDEVRKKNNTLEWKSGVQECFPRFRAVTESNGEYFVEFGFDACERSYRAILAWLESSSEFRVLTVVEKEEHYQTSRQKEIFEQIAKHGHKILEDVRDERRKTNR
jgi:hypothetical protein